MLGDLRADTRVVGGRPRWPSWADGTRRHCLPSLWPSEPSAGPFESPVGPSEPSAGPFESPVGPSEPSAGSFGPTPSPRGSPAPPPPSLNKSAGPPPSCRMRAAAARRWRMFADSPMCRYKVAPRVNVSRPDTGAAMTRSIDELAQQVEAERAPGVPQNYSLPQAHVSPPRQCIVRNARADPRTALIDMALKPAQLEITGLPARVLDGKILFDLTIGAVRPYALSSETFSLNRIRKGRQMPAMPPSARDCDPLKVFVEAMRFQRPTIGVHSFDVS